MHTNSIENNNVELDVVTSENLCSICFSLGFAAYALVEDYEFFSFVF